MESFYGLTILTKLLGIHVYLFWEYAGVNMAYSRAIQLQEQVGRIRKSRGV